MTDRVYRGCSPRAIVVGLVLAAFMGLAIPWGDMVIKGSQMGVWNTNPGAIFLFFVLVAIVNALLGLVHRRLALDAGELAVIYIMLLVANTLPARGFAAYVPAIATGALKVAKHALECRPVLEPGLGSEARDLIDSKRNVGASAGG